MTDKFPVIVETIERHLVWVEAADQEEAVETLRDDPEWYEAIDNSTHLDGAYDYSIDAVEDCDWETYVYPYNRIEGPRQACTECGTVAHAVQWKPWHTEQCSQHPAPVGAVAA